MAKPGGHGFDNPLARVAARLPVQIRTKLLVAFAAVVLLLIIVGVLGLRVLGESNDRLVTLGRLQQKAAVYRSLQNDNTALRKLVVLRGGTGDIDVFGGAPSSVPDNEIVELTLRQLADFYDSSRLEFVPNPAERRLLRRLQADYERLVAAMTKAVDLDRAGKVSEGHELVLREARPLVDRLEFSTDELATDTEASIVALRGANRADFVNSRRVFLAGAAAAVVLALVLGFALSSSLIGPVQRMDTRLGEIAAGDFSAHVQVSNRDELGTLAANLNRMNDELGRLYDVVQRQAADLADWNHTLEARVAEQAEELRASRARIVATADAERRKIERDLHDGAQQHLLALMVNLGLARQAMSDDPEAAAELLDQLRIDVRTTTEDLRELAHGIYPPILMDSGLPAALRAAAAHSPVAVTVTADGVGRHPPGLEATVYFCCLEALQNTAKHAPGAAVVIRTWEEPDALHFEVSDDGPGFDSETVTPGHGLVNMVDRVAAVGGAARWDSSPGHGTRVCGFVPLSG